MSVYRPIYKMIIFYNLEEKDLKLDIIIDQINEQIIQNGS